MMFYSTPGHGGFHVSELLLATMPEALRGPTFSGPGWYEEDCDAVLVMVAFPERFTPEEVANADASLKNGYLYDRWEKFHGRELAPGESRAKDEMHWYAEHKKDLIVTAAWGDWHEEVPSGMVGVCARPGGHTTAANRTTDRYFLVPNEEYDAKGKFGFIVDPAKHKEVGRIF